ncbi:MAG: SAM-dependent methyltransferase [Candidatus Kerfeldbacteria bacterium]|nr:SAM-dependent methyltransferase [Candidatus Kerfeldbacteria bacterium]
MPPKGRAESHPSSFRDPSGFVFISGENIFRQINLSYQEPFDHLMNSGLYQQLVSAGLLIPHVEVGSDGSTPPGAYKVIQPQKIAFISYPYEWSFHQWQDAALVTLQVQQRALEYGMTLKDASSFNIQFHNGRPTLIDTLSFELFAEGKPWIAYRQFCQHFLAPLALMAHVDLRLGRMLEQHLDGIPLDLASALLPRRTYAQVSLLSHIHLQAKVKTYFSRAKKPEKKHFISRFSHTTLVESLRQAIRRLQPPRRRTEWSGYYSETNYTPAAFARKKEIVDLWLQEIGPRRVLDLGANTGVFSFLACRKNAFTVAADADALAVDLLYREMKQQQERNLLPLVIDVTSPTPGVGWENTERLPFRHRGAFDAVLCLALVHHLALRQNLSFEQIAKFLRKLSPWLIVEFIPKEDSQAQRLLQLKEDIFPHYTQSNFLAVFQHFFTVHQQLPVGDSRRTLYLMRGKDP